MPEDLRVVDVEAELAVSFLVGGACAVELDGSETRARLVLKYRLALVEKCSGDIVQVRVAVAVRPPELRVVYPDRASARGVPETLLLPVELTVAALAVKPQRVVAYLVLGHREIPEETELGVGVLAVQVVRPDEDVVYPVLSLFEDIAGSPYTARDRARHDVPAVHMRGFTDEERIEAGGLMRAGDRNLVFPRGDDGGGDVDDDLVLALFQVRSAKLKGDEHIVGLSDEFSVDEDVRDSVDALEDEEGVLIRLVFKGESARVDEVQVLELLVFNRVAPEERVADEPGTLEIELKVSGNYGVNRLPSGEFQRGYGRDVLVLFPEPLVFDVPELPSAVEGRACVLKHKVSSIISGP